MKVLFAVSNENISTQIVKKYQKEYKEIISYKNMYYFNAIIKELQRDKSYDRIVISEDLEPFANNNSDAIEKFIFEKLDNISDEATGINGKDIPIILLATDKRRKSEDILVKLFGIGIYNILLGLDRTTDNVCSLLNKPRSKKEAKLYYKIESEEVSYKSENENNVSEIEIKNILNHYRKLGKDEDRYVESFNNIAAQYNDAQLRIITKFLPLNVKAVLEEQSPKYQSVMTFSGDSSTIDLMKKKKEEEGLKVGFLNYSNSSKPSEPVIVPTAVKKVAIKKINKEEKPVIKKEEILPGFDGVSETIEEDTLETTEPVKRGRGRPRKIFPDGEKNKVNVVKRGRGRPRKISPEVENEKEDILPGFDEVEEQDDILPGFEKVEEQDDILPGFEGIEEQDDILPGFDEIEEKEEDILPGFEEVGEQEDILPGFNEVEEPEDILPGFEEVEEQEDILPGFDEVEDKEDMLPGFDEVEDKEDILPGFDEVEDKEDILPGFDEVEEQESDNLPETDLDNIGLKNYSTNVDDALLLSKDKKVLSFVGTTKNGTSFIVNNLAKYLSSKGIKTAILDLTLNRNSYYIYTKNNEELRNVAYESIKRLQRGITEGITVDKNLDVYTALPGDKFSLDETEDIISTLTKNYSVILMDCDFSTPAQYFKIAQEIYIVQTMDIFTIQPMTAFLRDLKAKEILKEEKIRIIINKEFKVSGLTPKVIIGGLSNYNDPSMSFMTELFNRDNVKYCTIPFDMKVCSEYLEGVMNCEIKTNGYTKVFNTKLKELANMVYPLIDGKKQKRKLNDYSSSYNAFSEDMNNTLEQMKNRY